MPMNNQESVRSRYHTHQYIQNKHMSNAACMHVCVYVCMYTSMYTCKNVCIPLCINYTQLYLLKM